MLFKQTVFTRACGELNVIYVNPRGGGERHMKGMGMLVVSLRGVNSDFGLT